MLVNPVSNLISQKVHRNKNQQYVSKPPSLQYDCFELSFKGVNVPKRLPEEYQKLTSDLIDKLPEKIKQRITAKINIIMANTLTEAIESDVKTDGKTLHEELPEALMQLGDLIRDSLPSAHLKLIESIVKDSKSFEALPMGKSQLFLEANKNTEKALEETDKSVTLYANVEGKEVALPQEITDTLLMIRDLDLKDNQKAALLRSLTGADDESSLKGFAKVDEVKDVKQFDEAEKQGSFAAVGLGKDNYTMYLSTYNGMAEPGTFGNSVAKSLAAMIIHDYSLDFNRDIASAYERDIRVHNVHRAIDDKLKEAKAEIKSLTEMQNLLKAAPVIADKADSPIGIVQAMTDVITDMFFGTNRHDQSDKKLISMMYPTLSKSIAKELNPETQNLLT